MREGRTPPSVEEVAERAGVSVSSVFRYFDSLDDLHAQTIERYFERYEPLFEVPARPDGSTAERVAALVDARLELYETIAPIARAARVRAASEEGIAAYVYETHLCGTVPLYRRYITSPTDNFYITIVFLCF